MDIIFLKDFVVQGKHGAYAQEWLQPQTFIVDVEMKNDTRTAAHTDDLHNALNYADLHDFILTLFAGPSIHLIETLAERIAQEALKDPKATEVMVQVRKVEVYHDCVPGVRIVRTRE